MNDKGKSYILVYGGDLLDRPEFLFWCLDHPVYLLSSKLPYNDFCALIHELSKEPYSILELQHPFRTTGMSISEENAGFFALAMTSSLQLSIRSITGEPAP